MEKYLGKIDSVSFGHGGYQGCMIGLHLSFKFGCSGIGTNYSAWDAELIECTDNSKWTEEDRNKQYSDIVRKISKLLSDAKVDDIAKLNGIPVEVTVENGVFKDFRILTEVL